MGMKLRRVFAVSAVLLCLFSAAAWAADEDVVRIGIMRFSSKAANVSDSQAEAITDIFTRTMTNSKSIALIERERLDMIGREHKLNMSGLVDMGMAVEVGRLAGCQYMIMGSVTGLAEGASGGGFGGILVGNRVAEATIDMRVVDVTTTEIILSLVQTGSSTQQSSAFSMYGFTWAEVGLSDVQGQAITDAAVRLGHKIREELVGEYSQVLQVSGKTVNVNVGATTGAQKGDLYLVYSEGPEVHDLDGTPLGRERFPIAVVKIATVASGFSACEPVAGGGNVALIQRGDKIEPISSRDSRALAREKRFVKERPRVRAYQETMSDLFGEAGGALPEPGQSAGVFPETVEPMEPVAAEPVATEPVAAEPAALPPVEPAPEPAPSRPVGGLAGARASSGSNLENVSTDPAKVINTYSLDAGDKNLRRVGHLNARKFRRPQEVYDAYVALVDSYSADYLAAYQAGESARRMRNNEDALAWYDRALSINPNYEPAIKARDRMQ